MPVVKKVIKNCGCEVAKRQRRCARNKSHKIAPGEKCLVFRENMMKKNYCLQCARLLLDYAKKDIERLYEALEIEK